MDRDKISLNKIRDFSLRPRRKHWPSLAQWKKILTVFSKKEKRFFLFLIILALGSLVFLGVYLPLAPGERAPANGGIYTEGVIGRPRFINPIYASINDVDRDLTEVIFAGLMKYDKDGKVVPDLVSTYTIDETGTIYEIYLQDDLSWEDGAPLTADDAIFTIETIQNPDYNSPLRANWLGVSVEKISDKGIRFKLNNPYSKFLENLTIKILPLHVWKDIPAQNFPLAVHNLRPTGSGPYRIEEIKQDKLGYIRYLTLERNSYYYGQKPYIDKIVFYFFENEEELIEAAEDRKISGFSLMMTSDYSLPQDSFQEYNLTLPRYFAVFFNPEKNKILADKDIRKALSYGTDRNEIVEKVLGSAGAAANSPILPLVYGFEPPSENYEFNLEKAENLLDKTDYKKGEDGRRIKATIQGESAPFKSDLKKGSEGAEVTKLQECLASDPTVYPEGKVTGYFGSQTKEAVILFQEKYADEILKPWGFSQGTGLVSKTTRQKLNEVCGETSTETSSLTFSLVTVNQPQLVEVARLLKEQWAAIGVELNISIIEAPALEQDYIKPREYEALLFGEVLGSIPDPFPFWYSSQKQDPGLNLSLYQSKEVDQLLEEARQSQDEATRAEKLTAFQEILLGDMPAVFLYRPDYIYCASKKLNGFDTTIIVDPSKRFSNIGNWYLETKKETQW